MVRRACLSLLFISSLFLFCQHSFSQSSSLHGIDLGDLDRKADPCNDFFEFANGAWRANNPIPASMTRWSKRWAAGESSKDKLREILEAAAAWTSPG
jgi:putative endopeptidase